PTHRASHSSMAAQPLTVLLFTGSGARHDLLPFPTRRSSDLAAPPPGRAPGGHRPQAGFPAAAAGRRTGLAGRPAARPAPAAGPPSGAPAASPAPPPAPAGTGAPPPARCGPGFRARSPPPPAGGGTRPASDRRRAAQG